MNGDIMGENYFKGEWKNTFSIKKKLYEKEINPFGNENKM